MDIKEILTSKMSDRTKVELLSFMLEKAAPQQGPAQESAQEPKAAETLETPLTQQEQRQQGAESTLLELMGMFNAKQPSAPASAPAAQTALEEAAEKMRKAAETISQQIGFMAGYDSSAKTPIEEGHDAIAQLMLADNFKI